MKRAIGERDVWVECAGCGLKITATFHYWKDQTGGRECATGDWHRPKRSGLR